MVFSSNNRQNPAYYANRNQKFAESARQEESPKMPSFDIKNLSKELFDEIADECAKIISESKKKETNKSTQLRRFYDELVLWDERAGISEEAFKNALPFIFMIKSKVAYAKGRGTVDYVFQEFMNRLIDQITDIKTLKNAKLFMEAMMGFYKSYKQD